MAVTNLALFTLVLAFIILAGFLILLMLAYIWWPAEGSVVVWPVGVGHGA